MHIESLQLTDHETQFIQQAVELGGYSTPADVIHDALRVLEQQKETVRSEKLEELRAAVKIGFDQLDRGEYVECTVETLPQLFDEIWERAKKRHKQS